MHVLILVRIKSQFRVDSDRALSLAPMSVAVGVVVRAEPRLEILKLTQILGSS